MASSFELFKKQLDEAVGLIDQTTGTDKSESSVGSTQLLQSPAQMVDTQSLLARCEGICEKYEPKKPTIGIIHHLACSGGRELSEYISLMPNVYLLSEVHPFIQANSTQASLNLSDAINHAQLPNAQKLNEKIFVQNIKEAYQQVAKAGGELVIRDNAFFDYLNDEVVHNQTISNLLVQDFNVVSIVLFRDLIDTYVSLKHYKFFEKTQLSFDEFCKRTKTFLTDYKNAKLVRYEELNGDPEGTVKEISEYLNLSFNDAFELMARGIKIPQLDNWKGTEIDCYNTKLKPVPSLKEVGGSQSYFDIQKLIKLKEKKLILVASMPRSGSTWLFNCIREIYKIEEVDFYSCWVEDYEPNNPSLIHIVKVHNPEHRLSSQADIIISTRRDIRDVSCSLIRMGWLTDTEESILKQCSFIVDSLHPFWNKKAKLEIEYEDLLNNSEEVIKDVCNIIGVRPKIKAIEEISRYLKKLPSATQEFNKATQLHPQHRSEVVTSYKKMISDNIVKIINEQQSDWLSKYNYL